MDPLFKTAAFAHPMSKALIGFGSGCAPPTWLHTFLQNQWRLQLKQTFVALHTGVLCSLTCRLLYYLYGESLAAGTYYLSLLFVSGFFRRAGFLRVYSQTYSSAALFSSTNVSTLIFEHSPKMMSFKIWANKTLN